ncbi:uncharacterized protein LOC127853641 isoform X3 [Dreissena polymorpha]|uniref:uncharacterized protein LOC127853641 isoform X3 n=1 Tax=Dreissena polymorpha TaxID=45954 RepID=UPI0022644232|nr:uncharacterized protein LOC127853641 isoform X3 [Dreissena polymorpha]
MKIVCIGVLLCGIFYCCIVQTSSSPERPSQTINLETASIVSPGLLERIFLFPLTFLQDEPKSPTENDVVSTDTSLQICDGGTVFDVFIDAVTVIVWRIWNLLEENCEPLGLWDFNLDPHLVGTDTNPPDNGFGIISATFHQTSRLLPTFNIVKEVTKSSLITAIEKMDVSNARMRVLDLSTKVYEMMSHLLSIVTMTWMTLLRWTVATILAVSCFTYFLPNVNSNGNTKRRHFIVARLREKLKPKQQRTSPMSSPRAKVHYQMCEVYDTLPCNCGGRKTSLEHTHYRMCELFDRQRCNCGGRRNGPRELEKPHVKSEVLGGECCNYNCGKVFVENRSPVNIIVLGNPEAFIKLTRTRNGGLNELSTSFQESHNGISDVEDDSNVSIHIPKTVARIDTLEAAYHLDTIEAITAADHLDTIEAITAADHLDTIEAIEVADHLDTIYNGGDEVIELGTSLCSDIGQPCFNSSFKEESILNDLETMSHSSAYYSPAPGDSAELKLSPWKSPQKRRGPEDSSRANDSLWSFYDAESFLDTSNFDQNISFQRGDGIVEIAMILLVKGAIKITAWFMNKQGFIKASDGVTLQAENANTNSELRRRRPRNRIRYNRQFSGSQNNSAMKLHDTTLGSYCACGDFADTTDAENGKPKNIGNYPLEKMNCVGARDTNHSENNESILNNDVNDLMLEGCESDKEPAIIFRSNENIYYPINDDAYERGSHSSLLSRIPFTKINNNHSSDGGNNFKLSNDSESVTAIEENVAAFDQPVCRFLNEITDLNRDKELMIEGHESPTLEKDPSSAPEGVISDQIEQLNMEDNRLKCTATESVKPHEIVGSNLHTIEQIDAPKLNLCENTACMSVTENRELQNSQDSSRTVYVAINETTPSMCNYNTPILISDVAIQEDGNVKLPSEPITDAIDDRDNSDGIRTPELSASDGYLTDSSG